VLALLLVAASFWLALAIVEREPFGFQQDDESSLQGDREAVMAQASEFASLYLNYDKSDLDEQKKLTDYVARAKPLMTDEGGREFEESAVALAQLISEFGFTRKAEVTRAGVVSLNEDTAEVIVAGLLSGKQQGEAVGPDGFELTLSLAKVDGDWLVADIPTADEEVP
jgi:hypothetical protein